MSSSASQIRDNVLNDPGYWVEDINGQLYDAIVRFMEENKMNRTDLAKHLKISKGRVSQILNDGEINFSLEKIIRIAIMVNRYPAIKFVRKTDLFPKENEFKTLIPYNRAFSPVNIVRQDDKVCKVFKIKPWQEYSLANE